ncbi:MAG: ArnT family glycosyltransferase [Candidatus Brocadiia bacterium]
MSWWRTERRADLGLFALALALRLAWVGYIEARGGELTQPDAHSYEALATNFLRSKGLQKQDYAGLFADGRPSLTVRSFRPPLLPLVMAGIYALVGHAHAAVRVAMAVLSAATCVVVARMARRVFDASTGTLAGAGMAIYPKFIYYSGGLVTETLCTLLLAASVATLLAARRAGGASWRWAAGGVLLGLGTLSRSSLLLFPAAAALWVLVVCRPGRRAAGQAGLVLAGFVVAMAPWWVRNWRVHGHFVPATTEGGYTLWVTNNPRATGGGHCPMPQRRPEFDGLNEYQVDRLFFRKGLRHIREHPGHFLELAGAKFVRFWRLWPHAEHVGLGAAVVGGLSFVPVLALAVWGAARSLGRWRPLLLFYAVVAYFTLVHVVFMAVTRYRVPMTPYLIVLAAWGLSDLWRRLGRRSAHRIRRTDA